MVDAIADENSPIHLVEDPDTADRFLLYQTEEGVRVELKVAKSTFWATQQQMAEAFGVSRSNITKHLQNIFQEGELAEAAVSEELSLTARGGKVYPTKLYDLNAVISVGYRVGGPLGTAFRIWATDKL